MKKLLSLSLIFNVVLSVTFLLEVFFGFASSLVFEGAEVIDNDRIEYVDDGWFYLSDSDLDGNIDESYRYDTSGTLLSSRFDTDYDGVLETSIKYLNNRPSHVTVDSNKNGIGDITFSIKEEGKSLALRHQMINGEQYIAKVLMEFGFPVSTELIQTDLSEVAFEISQSH